MILRSISVAGWRCFLEPVEVGPFADGINIVYAPNGTGKSTLFAAMRHALLDGHSVSGREVEALRPWGRDLAPKVAVEFVHGGEEFRIAKQFLVHQSALLERKEDGRYRPLAEGTSADTKTRDLLTQNPPGKGFAQFKNWGLAQVLWAPQGSLSFSSLSEDLVTNIRSLLGPQVSGSGTDPIAGKIEERYLAFYTPTGKPRTGKDAPSLTGLERELEEAREAFRAALSDYQAFDDASRGVEDLRARREQSRLGAQEITKALENTRQRAEAYRALLAEQDRRSERAKTAEAQHEQLQQRISLIQKTEKAYAEAKNTLAAIEAEIPLKAREVQERAKEVERTRIALEDARQGRKDVEEAEDSAEEARRFAEGTKARVELDILIERIQATQQLLGEKRMDRSKLVAPNAKELRAIRKALKARDEAKVRLEASLIILEVTLEQDGQLDIVAGERTGPQPASKGVPVRIQGSPEIVAVIPGVARLRASGPIGSVEEHRTAWAKAEGKLAKLTAPFGSEDQEELETLAENATEVEADIAEAETQLETLLATKTLEGLVQERSIHEAVLSKILEPHPEWRESPPDPQALRSKAGDVKRAFIAEVEGTEAEWDKVQSALSTARGQEEAFVERLKDARDHMATLEASLAEYENDGKQAQDRETELRQLAMAWDAARTRLTEIEGELQSYQDDPLATAQQLEQQLEAASQTANQAREQELREETLLESISARGPYSLLALAEEKVLRLEEEVQRERLRMEAIRLLRETVAQCRAEVIAAVAQPVEAAATRTFQRIASRRMGRIRIGEALQPDGVIPEALSESVEIGNISGGEQEQLYLATRLALAEVLAQDERQMVALDDVLTATDAGRLARVMTILEEAAQRLQILVLTCHPERYRGLREARFFDLEAVVHNRR